MILQRFGGERARCFASKVDNTIDDSPYEEGIRLYKIWKAKASAEQDTLQTISISEIVKETLSCQGDCCFRIAINIDI